MKYRLYCVAIVACLLTACMSGCFKADKESLKAFTYPNDATVTASDYVILPPDDVTVICTSVPELMGTGSMLGQTQTVRPDGVISFERVGEITVAGKTPRQVAELIAERIAGMYKMTGDNPIEVRVRNMSHYYYMVGMVNQPGAKIFTGRETTLSALTKAVPNNLAWKDQIQVIRPSTNPKEPSKVFALDYRKLTEQGNMKCNVLLQEGDVIYVPPTILASIGLTVGEILSPVLQTGSAVNMFAAP
ncbi:MAG: polysaccharide biosynthesis/export family protein [Anaerohalosphaeraceae bacterium]